VRIDGDLNYTKSSFFNASQSEDKAQNIGGMEPFFLRSKSIGAESKIISSRGSEKSLNPSTWIIRNPHNQWDIVMIAPHATISIHDSRSAHSDETEA
jgi:hypothetical protein